MNITFADKKFQKMVNDDRKMLKEFGSLRAEKMRDRLAQLKLSNTLEDVRKIIMIKQNQYFPQSLPHPGKTLAEKMEEMGMNLKEFADYTGKSEKTIRAVLDGRSAITPDLALQFENVTLIPVHFWLNSQRYYDEFTAREKYKEPVQEAV